MKKPTKSAPNVQLKRAREHNGWSQEHVGQGVGTDAFTVSRWERGITMPSPHFRQKLTALFEMSAMELGLVPPEKEEQTGTGVSSPAALPLAQAQILDPAIPPPLAGEHGLVGRDELLRTLKQRLLAGKHATLSALNGLPGVGKTALATVLAHDDEVRAYFSDGVLWSGLGYEPDVLGLLSRWGTVLNCAPADLAQCSRPDAWAASIHAAIGQRRMLLVIDDAWEIAQALAFQVGGPNCAHVVTTRFPEIARRFAADGAIPVGELEDTDGRLLLMRLAPEVVQAEPEESQALVAAVGSLPLALTLLGNFLRAQSHSGQPRRLRAALEQLRSADRRLRLTEPQTLIGNHPSLSVGTPLSLQAVIGISDQQVSEEARTTLRALSAFPPKPNTFSEEAAVAVSAMPLEALDELTDAGLVESSGPERYTLHQTIADYARAHLTDTSVTERMVTYFVAYVEAHALDYKALDFESNNILAALEAAFEQKLLPDLVRGVHAFAPLLITRGLYTMAEAQLQRALEATKVLEDDIGRATSLLHLGKIAEQRGNYVQAQVYWQHGLMLARESGHRSSVAQTLRELGNLAWVQGQLQQAQQFLEEALTMLRELDDQLGIADTLKILGHLAADQGQPELARRLYEEARDIYQRLGDQRGYAVSLHNLGIMAREQGQFEQAYQLYQEALTILRDLKELRSVASILNNLGHLSRQQGQMEQARQFLEDAVALQRRLENRRGYAFSLLNLGSLWSDMGQLEQAHRVLNEALPIFRDLQDRRDIALTLQTLGILARLQGQMEQAHTFLDETLAISQDLKDKRWIALTFREQGILARQQEQFEQAHRHYEEALDIFYQLGDQREAAVTCLEQGILARQQEQLAEAYPLLTEALATLRQLRDRRNVACTLKEIGILHQQQGQLGDALPLLISANIGLSLMSAPETHAVEKILEQVRTQMGESAFIAATRQTLQEAPESAYGLDQAAWEAAIRRLTKLTKQALAK
ncbi:MAG TPA: tetratricopeptide repeat protein [Ktedonobacteraceae bacterium]|nr:tetratricopeptide repeat protein [Ktedonobacteraceae bacterium]